MVKTLFAAIALALASSMASATDTVPDAWYIVNWEAGCARRGCFYRFNLTSPAYEEVPGFLANCDGDEERINPKTVFKRCSILDKGTANRGVYAKFVPRDDPNAIGLKQIELLYSYTDTDNGDVRNFTATRDIVFNQFIAPRQNFTVKGIEEV
ncbi:hypothetical protein FKW77_001904 [Venturia effusa]|uniref:Uncharacterized protein n=1 Tax=Venturia effusa TaxID=50376 RepID=A0A517L6Q5_9PEZI|nr:hypothetical protein FKW77_001904 [Venturia effusa]